MNASDTPRARVDFVLVNVPAFDAASGDKPLPALDLRLAELSAHFTMATFGLSLGEIAFADSHDAALARGTRDFCLIQKVGHLFSGPPADVAASLIEALADCAFLTGHIMERGGYYYLHDQCVLVNRRAWERLGKPAFGAPTSTPQRVAVPRRSPDNVHDDYTPLFLDPTGQEKQHEGAFGYGWHAISESLRHGMRVANWGEGPRRWKRYCYAYYGNPAEWQRALGDVPAAPVTADGGLRDILAFLKAAAPRLPSIETDAVDVPHFRLRAGLDHVVAPAAADAYRVLDQIGFHPQTVVTFYGADAAALSTQQRMAEDGWRERWAQFQRLPHRFVVADPVADPDGFARLCAADGASVVVSLGACFNGFATIACFDGARRRRAYDRVVATLKANSRRYLVIGQPPYQRIRGI